MAPWNVVIKRLSTRNLLRKLYKAMIVMHINLLLDQGCISKSLVIDSLFEEFVEIKVVFHQKLDVGSFELSSFVPKDL